MNIRDAKKLLIFLYEYFNGDNNAIMKEILEKNLNIAKNDVNDFIKQNKIRLKKYVTCFESNFDANEFVLIYKKD